MTAPTIKPTCGNCVHLVRKLAPSADSNTHKMADLGWFVCAHLERWRFFHANSSCALPSKFFPINPIKEASC